MQYAKGIINGNEAGFARNKESPGTPVFERRFIDPFFGSDRPKKWILTRQAYKWIFFLESVGGNFIFRKNHVGSLWRAEKTAPKNWYKRIFF
jgi:hypothetical protein